jgi:3-oxoadipate enol-lactonase
MWDGVVAALPDRFVPLRYDQRDRGRQGGLIAFSLDDLVDDLLARLDHAHVQSAHVVGISLGGLVALRAASRAPGRVRTLTAMCCAARFPREIWLERGRLVRDGGFTSLVPAIIDRWFTTEFQAEHPALVDARRRELESTDVDGYAFACDVLAEADLREELAGIRVPTLAISAESDIANRPEDLDKIAHRIPGAHHETLPRVAHLAPVAAPRQTVDLLVRHFEHQDPVTDPGGHAR